MNIEYSDLLVFRWFLSFCGRNKLEFFKRRGINLRFLLIFLWLFGDVGGIRGIIIGFMVKEKVDFYNMIFCSIVSIFLVLIFVKIILYLCIFFYFR